MKKGFYTLLLLFNTAVLSAQLVWQNVDSLYQPLPKSVHIYYTDTKIDTSPFKAYYVIADLKDKKLDFTADTTYKRRFTPAQFYEKNDKPLLVVNCTFFSFETNQNLNVVIKDRKIVGYNIHTIPGKGKDTLTFRHPFVSGFGISRKRIPDVAWLFSDSSQKFVYYRPRSVTAFKDSLNTFGLEYARSANSKIVDTEKGGVIDFKKWKMKTAVGGGPVLIQYGNIKITNNEELKFTGKAINDKHPRTAMGYTKDNKLIILVVEGRNPNAAGATLTQEAQILKDLGCWEALNLDGGGSSCMLINGKETIKTSDKSGQRPVPAVFIIKSK